MIHHRQSSDVNAYLTFFGIFALSIFIVNDAFAQAQHTSIGRVLCSIQYIMGTRVARALGAIAIGIVAILATLNKVRLTYAILLIVGISVMVYSRIIVMQITGQSISNVNCPISLVNISITRSLCTVVGWFSGNLGSALSTIAICNLAAASLYGKINWGATITAACGIAAIFQLPEVFRALGYGWICTV